MINNILLPIIKSNKQGYPLGIYSVCSANKYVLEAVMTQAQKDGTTLLVEATSNQVNQFGGYTGMKPRQFVAFVHKIANSIRFPLDRLVLGGDHLGPNVWQTENAKDAMEKAVDLIRSYVDAGFCKIHLDTSMHCADDYSDPHTPLDEQTVAERAVELCLVAEEVSDKRPADCPSLIYVIGTEVPIPGGSKEELTGINVTQAENVKQTLEITKLAFLNRGLKSAWERVIAVVVQPGVEFSDTAVIEYDRDKAAHLSKFIKNVPNLVYEAHSTDYQKRESLKQMVEDHFAILKVGPALTYAFREAVFALAEMEQEWLKERKDVSLSCIKDVLDKAMLSNPIYWQKHYHGDNRTLSFTRKYSYSDRIRYYWPVTFVVETLSKLIQNLMQYPVPLTLLSQYMPIQYRAVREGKIKNYPVDLIHDKIMEIARMYAYATGLLN